VVIRVQPLKRKRDMDTHYKIEKEIPITPTMRSQSWKRDCIPYALKLMENMEEFIDHVIATNKMTFVKHMEIGDSVTVNTLEEYGLILGRVKMYGWNHQSRRARKEGEIKIWRVRLHPGRVYDKYQRELIN
jgi:hypothetical protein